MKLSGNTDYAVVCGANMVFEPFIYQYYQELGMCSPIGVSAVLDESADGFVKGEAVCCVLLQRRMGAHRVYAQVLSARVGTDGNKKLGVFHPSSETQEELMIASYKEANIDPLNITYFESHGTGTKVRYNVFSSKCNMILFNMFLGGRPARNESDIQCLLSSTGTYKPPTGGRPQEQYGSLGVEFRCGRYYQSVDRI
jgi:hypothetical protein